MPGYPQHFEERYYTLMLRSVMALAGFEGFGRIPQFFEKDLQIPPYLDQYIQSNCPPIDLTDGKTVL